MAQRKGGLRRKTRGKFKKNYRLKGKINLRKYLQKFENGDKVYLKADPTTQKGLYFRRFHGLSGIIKNKKGTCYEVQIKDGNIKKTLIIHPTHLKKWEAQK